MRLPRRLALLLVALLAAGGWETAAGASAHRAGATQEIVTVKQLVTEVNGARLAAISALFTPSAVLRVSKSSTTSSYRAWRGSRAITAWWKSELAHRLRISLESAVRASGSSAQAVMRRTTRGGDCPSSCWEQASWRFSGSRLAQMTLVSTAHPVLPTPYPLKTVPPPPRGPPPPNITPTIPT